MRAGFALQIVAHLPIIATLMRACESGDVLPGDQPFVAIRLGTDGRNWQRGDERSSFGGNAREIRERQVANIAHHAHVTPFLTGTPARPHLPLPIADENGERLKEEGLVTP